jgi:cytochrome oxidase Cu insertion factor (SCO1/SenC/PrrC family)
LPRHREIAAFELEDSYGRPVSRADLTGHVTVVSFFLSSCAASSIGVTKRMAELQQQTAGLPGVSLLSLTVDPQEDQPATLRQYGLQYGADSNRWRFVTGPRNDVRSVIQGSFLSAEAAEKARRNGTDPLLEQCDHLAVVDGDGWVRGWFDGTRFGTVPKVMAAVNELRTNSPSRTTR